MELLFKNIERQVSLNAKEKKILSETFRHKKVKRKQLLVEAGELNKYLYFVLSGCLRAYYIDKNGFEHVVSFALEDWWMSDFGFHTGSPSILTIDSLEDSEVLCIDKESLDRLYDQIPQLDRYFRIIMQNALMAQMQRIMQMKIGRAHV